MQQLKSLHINKTNQGQSLVELALFLPILIFILVGIVEVGNLLNTQNRVTTASRVAAGFGATNFDPVDWPGTADAMGVVALNTVTETLELSPDLWDIWSVHAITNEDGTGFDVYTSTQVFGINSVVPLAEWATISPGVQSDMLTALRAECSGGTFTCAGGIEVVASVPFHNIDTILGLPLWQWTGLSRIQGLTVMRVGEKEDYAGCPILPITIRLEQYSLYPEDWPCGYEVGGCTPADIDDVRAPWYREPVTGAPLYPGDPVVRFPDDFGSQMTVPPAPYTNDAVALDLASANYPANTPGTPLALAKFGDLYWAREDDAAPGQFGWLSWRNTNDTPNLDASLAIDPPPPGNFLDPVNGYPTGPVDRGTIGNGAFGPTGDGDERLEIGEWMSGATGNINVARNWMQEYIDLGIKPTLLVYSQTNGLKGANTNYQVAGFMNIEVVGYKFQTSEKWIVFRVVQWPAEECLDLGPQVGYP